MKKKLQLEIVQNLTKATELMLWGSGFLISPFIVFKLPPCNDISHGLGPEREPLLYLSALFSSVICGIISPQK